MRRALHRLTVGTAAITTLTLASTTAWADGGVHIEGDGSGRSVTVEAKDPGSGGGKSSGGGSPSDEGKSSGDSSSSGSGGSSGGSSRKESSGDGGGGATTSVSSGGRTNVGNYSGGSPSSVSSSSPDNVEILDDGSRATYTPEGAYVQGENGGATAFFDGMAQGQPDPADSVPADPAQPQDPAPQEGGEPAAPQVDPGELAQTAVSEMGLEAPGIASTPNDPDTLGAVGLPVWLWVANPGETTTGPNTTSATAGDVTVTATATFSGMTIDMGDGTTIECDGPGTEYPGTGIEPSPDCGHVYEQMSDDQPGGLYTVDIIAHWSVDWEANTGEGGQIPIDLTTDKQLRIGSYQTVVTDVS